MSGSANILVGLVVVAWILWRQVQQRPVREDRKPTVLLILLVLGVVALGAYFKKEPATGLAIALLAGSLVLAAGFGVVRGYTVRLWRQDGVLFRQGTWLTILLWLAAIGSHLGLDVLIDSGAKGLGGASILLYLAVSLGAQRLVVQARATRLGSFA
ncbi:hypothetical protein AB0C38_00415 [Amycolatopsis sp. NPDC048633]|uniref:hypothetical protein n=1 Tax=Amycolatopsis sp. NPDC048633 TaxID=3157095 RepID=UPI0033FD5E88